MYLSIKAKANSAFLLALLALGIMAAFSWRASHSLKENDRLVSHSHDVLETSASLRGHLGEAITARRLFLMGDVQQPLVFERARGLALSDFATLRSLVTDNGGQEHRLDQLEPLLLSRLDLQKRSIEAHRENKNDEAEQNALTAQGASVAARFSVLQEEFENTEREFLRDRSAAAGASNRRNTIAGGILAVSALVFLFVAITVLNRELSRRAIAEEAMGNQRALLRSILDSCGDSIIVADSTGKVVLRNTMAMRRFPIFPEHFDDDAPAKLGFHRADEKTQLAQQELPLVRTVRGEALDGEEIFVRPDGVEKPRWIVATGRPLISETGKNKGGVVFYRDITDSKRADALLQAAYRDAETTAKEKSRLGELGDLFQSCETLDEACSVVKASLPGLFDNCPGILYLTNSSRNITESIAAWGSCSTSRSAFAPNDCWALRMGKIYEGGSAGRLKCTHVSSENVEYLCVPLAAQGETLGVLFVEKPPSESDAATVQQALRRRAGAVAERVSLAFANLRLRETLRSQSIRDPLTGLFNRRYLEESLEREIHRATRARANVAVVMIDLDHFKAFKDNFGHSAGDAVLREAAMAMKERVRAADLVCRYGGEEFALVLPDTDLDGAIFCVEEIRQRIKTLKVQYGSRLLGMITISAGVALYPAHGDTPRAVIEAADQALYEAKKQGRDRVLTCGRVHSSSASSSVAAALESQSQT